MEGQRIVMRKFKGNAQKQPHGGDNNHGATLLKLQKAQISQTLDAHNE